MNNEKEIKVSILPKDVIRILNNKCIEIEIMVDDVNRLLTLYPCDCNECKEGFKALSLSL